VPIVLKSGSINLLEPSGSLQACNGIALPLPLTVNKVAILFTEKKRIDVTAMKMKKSFT
jgi:hypothetical protein